MENCSPSPSSSPCSSSSSREPKVAMDVPLFFRCPISMELMEDPVTISTGVSYDRKNIEKWFFVYKKTTCPATMQRLENFDLTPNHTLKRLISSFDASPPPTIESPPPTTTTSAELETLLQTIQSAPFKVNLLKKLRSAVAVAAAGDEVAIDLLVQSGGIEVLTHIVEQPSVESNVDFTAFRSAEEAVGILHHLPLPDNASIQPLTTPGCMASMVALLQGGSSDARVHTVTLIQKITRTSSDWCRAMADQDVEFYKSLLDLLSDGASTIATSASIDVLLEIMKASKRRRLRAVEAGAAPVLIELLPDANRHRCEKLLLLLKLLCGCPEGRSAVTEHGMGVAVVSKKVLRVSDAATKIAVKILWLICSSAGTEKVVDEMMGFGAVTKMLALLQMDCRASMKEMVVKILRLHGGAWKHYPCLSKELKECLRLVNNYQLN